MILDSQLPELKAFRKVEKRLPLSVDTDSGAGIAPGGNEARPIHNWFRFKESFSAELVHDLVREFQSDLGRSFRLLDPFCGVGTTLVGSQELSSEGFRVTALGIEHNPFIGFVARTKAAWPVLDVSEFSAAAGHIFDELRPGDELPQLSSITTAKCISRHMAERIVSVRKSIEGSTVGQVRQSLLLGLAACIESLSRTRKDGRALRIVKRPSSRIRPTVEQRWQAMAVDLATMRARFPLANSATVLRGDGRRPSTLGIAPESVDLIVTSPPYPNNIDYTEVYKLELWFLDFVKSGDEFFKLRSRTFRSHPTTEISKPADEFMHLAKTGRLRQTLWPLMVRTESMKDPWRSRLLVGYFEDLWVALREYATVLRSGGRAVFVVGNSLHGGSDQPYLVPTDLILAGLTARCGFTVENISVARAFRRRLSGNHFLRETVIGLRRDA